MHEPAVDILMATYNGGRYIGEQINSILKQGFTKWRLLVHDDGSTDETLAIVKQYQERDGRIKLIEDGICGLGAAQNYMHLLKVTDAGLCAFCDQDDIWFPDKLQKLIDAIHHVKVPAMVYANACFYVNGKAMDKKTTTIHPRDLKSALFMNSGIQGCSLMANSLLLDMLKSYQGKIAMHDHLITIGAAAFGNIHYVDEVLMHYRQHAQNVTTNHVPEFRRRIWSFLFGGKAVIDREHFEANKSFFTFFAEQMDKHTKALFKAYFGYVDSSSVFQRIWIVLKNGFTLGDRKGFLLVKTMIRKAID